MASNNNNNNNKIKSVKAEVDLLIPEILDSAMVDQDGVFIDTNLLKRVIERVIGVYDSRSVETRIQKLVNEEVIEGAALDKSGKFGHYNIKLSVFDRMKKIKGIWVSKLPT